MKGMLALYLLFLFVSSAFASTVQKYEILCPEHSSQCSEAQLFHTLRVGIINPMPLEQKPILGVINIQALVKISKYWFIVGNIGEVQIVSIRSGEKEYAATMATTLLNSYFNLSYAILTGTAGSRNPYIIPGDVVVSGFVVDKSSIHYHNSGAQTDYTGLETVLNANQAAILNDSLWITEQGSSVTSNNLSKSFEKVLNSANYSYLSAIPVSSFLLNTSKKLDFKTFLGNISFFAATGIETKHEQIASRVWYGVIGSANQWTEPLGWQAAQNALYPSDAGENEGAAFALTNLHFETPCLVIRGISDSPWFPSAYVGSLAAERAASVGLFVVKQLQSQVLEVPLRKLQYTSDIGDLSGESNAARLNYLVAKRAYYSVPEVSRVVYTSTSKEQDLNLTSFYEDYHTNASLQLLRMRSA